MTGKSRCHHIPLGSSPEHRCTNKAFVRALRRHRAGSTPSTRIGAWPTLSASSTP